MGDTIIRFANAGDCELLAIVIATVIQDIPYYNDLAKQTEISKFQPYDLQVKIASDPYAVLIATSGDSITGFCLTRFDDFLIWLEWFGVPKSHRGKGIAHLLLNELDTTIRLRKCHKIWCDCRTLNEGSIHILIKHGYKQLVTIKNHWYTQDFILWEKPA